MQSFIEECSEKAIEGEEEHIVLHEIEEQLFTLLN